MLYKKQPTTGTAALADRHDPNYHKFACATNHTNNTTKTVNSAPTTTAVSSAAIKHSLLEINATVAISLTEIKNNRTTYEEHE